MVMRLPRRRSGRRFRIAVVLIILAFLISISTIVAFYTDLLWYRELGFAQVFWTILRSKVLLALGFGLVFFLFAMLNLALVMRIMPTYRMAIDPTDPMERYRGSFLPYFRWIAIGVSGFLGLLFALAVTPYWERILLALNSVPFGTTDPVFNRDLSFFVFRLPFYEFLYGWLFTGLVVVTIVALLAHYVTGGIRPQSPGDRVTPQVKAHLSALLGLIALLRAWGYRLDQFKLLYSERGDITGASYTDIHAERPALTLLIVISVIVAGLFLVNIRRRGWVLPLAGVGLWLLISVLALGAFPFVIQRFTVVPSQLQKEQPFIERNIEATRVGYGIDSIEERESDVITGITGEAVNSNRPTIDNIRLWDPETLSTAYRQLQNIRTYYEFADVDVDRYSIDGRLHQVMLSAREMALQNLDTTAWQNLHVVYTHGYGAVVSPANKVSPEGGPTFLVQNVPPQSSAPTLEVKQPGVYYGEGMSDYSLVRTEQQELDFGTETGNEFTTYAGSGGVKVSGLIRRLAFAWRFRAANIAISGLIDEDSRIIYFRNVHERLRKAAPFLRFDGDPYPVIAGGRLVWIADGYTVSDMFPYSERIEFGERTVRRSVRGEVIGPTIEGRNNYIRNSVKATIDAYDGTVTFYVWDPKDPIIGAWRGIFPDVFKDASQMPEELRTHVRYPEDLFRIQTAIYQRWHMTDPRTFFTREDQWVIPDDPTSRAIAGAGVLSEIQPYYLLMKLPDSDQEEYILFLPFNPRGRPNMVAYVAAKSGPEDYGKLIDFRFPKGRLIHGVNQVHSRINSTPEISTARSLLGREGSDVIFGNLLVIPIQNSVLYAQPFFVQATANPIPELKRVILATSERVVMGNTLEDALRLLLEGGPVAVGEPGELGPTSVEEAIAEALQHFEAAKAALREGDLARYEREIKAAEDALRRSRSPSPSPSPSPTR